MGSATTERTLIILKPDAVQRGLVGPIIERFERRGLKIVAMRLMHIDRDLAESHYGVHRSRPFFEGLVSYITSAPVVVAVLEGRNAISVVRTTMGATNAAEAAPGTIRGDFALEIGRNLVHGSDSEQSASDEIALYFKAEDIVVYGRAIDPWVTEA
ncbi:MAG: Nucleoside-diphosphate kinase [Chloroflexi bacterium]|nr:Nucleoside-diphosphate kinase [Chloroflexota bacterium]